MIRLAITPDGGLLVGRAVKYTVELKRQTCPYTEHGDNSPCGDWCPHFMEPVLEPGHGDSAVMVQLCHGTAHFCAESEFADYRETGKVL